MTQEATKQFKEIIEKLEEKNKKIEALLLKKEREENLVRVKELFVFIKNNAFCAFPEDTSMGYVIWETEVIEEIKRIWPEVKEC